MRLRRHNQQTPPPGDSNHLQWFLRLQYQLQALSIPPQKQYHGSPSRMDRLPEELIVAILCYIQPSEGLAQCQLVCKRWERIAKPILFRHVCLRKPFPNLLEQENILPYIRCLSLGLDEPEEIYDLNRDSRVFRALVDRATVAAVSQNSWSDFATRLAGWSPNAIPGCPPALRELDIPSKTPYVPASMFIWIRKLQIDVEAITLHDGLLFRRLEELRLVSRSVNIVKLKAFLARHKRLRKLHVSLVPSLGPLSEEFQAQIKQDLCSILCADCAASVVEVAYSEAGAQTRFFLGSIRTQVDTMRNPESTKIIKSLDEIVDQLKKSEDDRISTQLCQIKGFLPATVTQNLEHAGWDNEVNKTRQYYVTNIDNVSTMNTDSR
ncbi:hypothetical protein BX600DRAFT_464637 [Xylariales sp. PMI_506]|nr:hypothetical protein BX600DRAFT_464637 [Xylariales sp. PMI_506]